MYNEREMQGGGMRVPQSIIRSPSRRHFLRSAGILGGMAATFQAWADTYIDLDLPGGPDKRELSTAFPQKAAMIVQRTRPPLLENSLEYLRSQRVHAQRSVLCALALGGDP